MKKQLYITTLFCFTAFSIQSSAGRPLNRFEITRVKSRDFEAEVKRRIKNKQAQADRYQGRCSLNRRPIARLNRVLAWRAGGCQLNASSIFLNKQGIQLVRDILDSLNSQYSRSDFSQPAGGTSVAEYMRKKKAQRRLLSLKTMPIKGFVKLYRERKVSKAELQELGRTRELMSFCAQEAKDRRAQESQKQLEGK